MPEGSMESDSVESQPVELQPFIHQVGGHTSMFRFNENTVCKPLCSREYHFYSTLPSELHPFTPECRGVVQVAVTAVEGDGFRLLAHRFSPDSQHCDNRHPQKHPVTPSSEREAGGEVSDKIHQDDPSVTANQNPWIENVFNRQMGRLSHKTSNSFLLLENVVCRYRKPCVLDLKMGQRQHGDDASPEKRQLFLQRCKASTSNQLGVRASGMKVYQVDSGEYIYFSKYDGRALNVDGFKSSLGQFLHNGQRLRYELIAPILCKLRQLRTVVETMNTFRFYSSSLLIMYDGIEGSSASGRQLRMLASQSEDSASSSRDGHDSRIRNPQGIETRVDVRMVDFAHSTFQGFKQEDEDHEGTDSGYLIGLSTLVSIFEELQQQLSHTALSQQQLANTALSQQQLANTALS